MLLNGIPLKQNYADGPEEKRKDKIFAEYTVSQLREGKIVSWSVADKLCTLLNCQLDDIIGHRKED